MKHLFVPYSLALLAKEKGFNTQGHINDLCLTYWFTEKGKDPQIRWKDIDINGWANDEGCHTTAPLYQQLVDWFREKHKIFIHVEPEHDYKTLKYYKGQLVVKGRWLRLEVKFNTYYEALTAALTEAFKLI